MNKKEFIKAFDEYHKFIYRFIYFRVNKSRELTEDLTQDTFLKAWQNKNKFDRKKSSMKTWLAIIARNLVIDNYRKYKNVKFIDIENSKEVFIEGPNDSDIRVTEIRRNINDLKEKEREGLLLRYFEELEIHEIAQIWNEKPETTRTFIFRALNKLKNNINEKNRKFN